MSQAFRPTLGGGHKTASVSVDSSTTTEVEGLQACRSGKCNMCRINEGVPIYLSGRRDRKPVGPQQYDTHKGTRSPGGRWRRNPRTGARKGTRHRHRSTGRRQCNLFERPLSAPLHHTPKDRRREGGLTRSEELGRAAASQNASDKTRLNDRGMQGDAGAAKERPQACRYMLALLVLKRTQAYRCEKKDHMCSGLQ